MAIRKKQPAPSKKKPPAFDRPKRGGGRNTIQPAPSKGGRPKLKKDGPKKDAPKRDVPKRPSPDGSKKNPFPRKPPAKGGGRKQQPAPSKGRTPIKGKPAVQPKKPGQRRMKHAVQPKQKRFKFKK